MSVAKASLKCYLPDFNLTYCEKRLAKFVWQLCKRVHSIHYARLVITIITCITRIINIEWFIPCVQYSIEHWSEVTPVEYRVLFFDYLELGSSSEVEDNRRWVSSIDPPAFSCLLPLRLCEPSDAVVVMIHFHQHYRGAFVITQPMEGFASETMF